MTKPVLTAAVPEGPALIGLSLPAGTPDARVTVTDPATLDERVYVFVEGVCPVLPADLGPVARVLDLPTANPAAGNPDAAKPQSKDVL